MSVVCPQSVMFLIIVIIIIKLSKLFDITFEIRMQDEITV